MMNKWEHTHSGTANWRLLVYMTLIMFIIYTAADKCITGIKFISISVLVFVSIVNNYHLGWF